MPGLLATRADTIPADTPYLSAPNSAGAELEAGLGQASERKKIGIVWAGSPAHQNDRNRSCDAAHFARLAEVPNVALFNMQKDAAPEALGQLPLGADLAPYLDDFSATAFAAERMDLIVTVDTALAHLASALGRPVWLLLPYAPEWRWRLGRDDSPWYPTMRLFRQARPGDWDGLFARVCQALAKFGWTTM